MYRVNYTKGSSLSYKTTRERKKNYFVCLKLSVQKVLPCNTNHLKNKKKVQLNILKKVQLNIVSEKFFSFIQNLNCGKKKKKL